MMVEAAAAPQTIKETDISRKVFGGILLYDGAGYYPGLELLNLVIGTVGEQKLPGGDEVKLKRTAHDFTRRLVWDEEFHLHPARENALVDDKTENAIRRLMECLQLKIPSSNNRPSWSRAHFFPYSPSLIHWDARQRPKRSNNISIERIYLRGGGALAFRVLRRDPDPVRLERCRRGFETLLSGQSTPLENLVSVLAAHGKSDQEAKVDDIERDSVSRGDEIEELYCEGVARILEHVELSTVARVRALMNWTGFWLILAQHNRAAESISDQNPHIICDCSGKYPQLRRASQRCLKDVQALIVRAVNAAADAEGAVLSKKGQNNMRSFYWATAATIKLLNAWKGRRHFTLGLDILETLVLAGCDGKSEVPYDEFVNNWLYRRCGIIVGRSAAEKSGFLSTFDAGIFEDNEMSLAVQMEAAGLLTQYSDATRMVGTGGLQ